jgi:hypothetical protein
LPAIILALISFKNFALDSSCRNKISIDMPFNNTKIWQSFGKKQINLHVSQGEETKEMYQI